MQNKELFEKALMKSVRFQEAMRPALLKIAESLADSEEVLLSLFGFYQDEGIQWRYAGPPQVSCEKDGTIITLSVGGDEVKLEKEDFFACLALLSDVFLPVLPLGSVVRLTPDSFDRMESLSDYAPEVVIVDRYLSVPEAGIYFPYTGVVYPLGSFGTEQKIQFGPHLVKEVLSRGYSDEKEEAFLALMKEEYILEKGLHSMSFATGNDAAMLSSLIDAGSGETQIERN